MSHSDTLDKVLEAMPVAGPSKRDTKEYTIKDFQAVLDSTPLFMSQTPESSEDNEVLQALQSLMFEGEGDDIALNFKNHGNELYSQKTYREAIHAYTQGLDAGPKDQTLKISLLNNRAACNLALKNYGEVLKDTGVIIVLSIQGGRGVPVKAMFRAGQALVALGRWREALDVVKRGKELAGGDDGAVWKGLKGDVERGMKRDGERVERIRREGLRKRALRKAIQSRGLIIVDTPNPPDNPHPPSFDTTSLAPDPPLYPQTPDSPYTPPPESTPIIFPVFLLYPTHAQSDLITHFHEDSTFSDQLNAMFPNAPDTHSPLWAQWDEKREYWVDNLVVYVETRGRRLLKVGKVLTLREAVERAVKVGEGEEKDGVVLRDGLLSFVVLPKGDKEKAWIEEFKRKRDQSK